MLNVGSYIRGRLRADDQVYAVVADRIYPGVGPLRAIEQAYVVYGCTSVGMLQAMGGPAATGEAEYSLTVRSTDYATSWEVAERIASNDVLGDWQDPGHGVRTCRCLDLSDGQTELLTEGSETLVYPVTLRLKLWITESTDGL